MRRVLLCLLGLSACAPASLPADLQRAVDVIHPISDQVVIVVSEDHITSADPEGLIVDRAEIWVRCEGDPGLRRCAWLRSESAVLALGEVSEEGGRGTLPIVAVDPRAGAIRWRREVSLDRFDRAAEGPVAAGIEHCLVDDPREPRRDRGVVVDLDCASGDELWRRTFADVQAVHRGRARALVIGGRLGPPPGHTRAGAWLPGAVALESVCAGHEARVVDLATGAITGRFAVDPLAHATMGGVVLTVAGDDLVALDLDDAAAPPATIVPGFGARLRGVDLRRLEGHARGEAIVLALGDDPMWSPVTWLIGVDPVAHEPRWFFRVDGQLDLGEVGAEGLPPAALVPTRSGHGVLDLRSGELVSEWSAPDVVGTLMWPPASRGIGVVIDGGGVRLNLRGSRVQVHDPTSGALLRELDLAAKTGAIAATEETIWMRAGRPWPPWTRLDRGTLTPVGDDRYLSPVEVEIPPGLAAPPVVADDRVRPRIWSDEARMTPAPEPLAMDLRRRLDVVADAPVYTFDGPIEPCEGTCPPSPAAYVLVEDGDVQRLVAVDAGGRGAIRGEVRCDHRPTALERARFIRLVHR